MVLPWLLGAAGTVTSHVVTKDTEKKKSKEKFDLAKKLMDLTPEQAQAVDAIKEQEVEEVRERVRRGIGPFKPLPEQASDRAREARAAALQRKADMLAELTPEERDFIDRAPDKERAIEQVVENKVRSQEGRKVVAELKQGTIQDVFLPQERSAQPNGAHHLEGSFG